MKALVTGAGGFLGGAIARALVAAGHETASFSRNDYPELERLGIKQFKGDLSDYSAVAAACAGADTVFHVAAKVGVWGSYNDFYKANVTGTENVIKACRAAGVKKLVFTGSPSVVFEGKDVEGATQSAPYPEVFDSHYSHTKALAEQLVLKTNSPELATVSLRPHLVWGPGHNHIISRIVAQGRAGQLRRISGFNRLVDTTYIDDAAAAHLNAVQRLEHGAACAGKAYFISQGDPRPIWDTINAILAAAGLPPVEKSVPRPLAFAAAALMETAYKLAGARHEPRLTVFIVKQLTTAHWFDITAARRDLGYSPAVSFEEGMRRLSIWLKEQK